MLYAVILAGGKGERFWPYSREDCPKQFLQLIGNRTMLQQTVDRLNGLINSDKIYVITEHRYVDLVKKQLPDLPEGNIIKEPCGRDTAAAVGLGAVHLSLLHPRSVMLVLPADHYINDQHLFLQILHGAVTAAAKGEHVITLGVLPTRPETGYGYIKQGCLHETFEGVPTHRVDHFAEKPNHEHAVKFLSQGNYLWNSGIFVWRVDLIRQLIAKYLDKLNHGLNIIEQALKNEDTNTVVDEVYLNLPKISLDYGIMERASNVLVIPCDFGWDDVGTWPALERHRETDASNNVLNAKGVFLNTRECLILSPRTVATQGVEKLIIVDHGECLLVCHKDKAQEIKQVVQALKQAGYKDLT